MYDDVAFETAAADCERIIASLSAVVVGQGELLTSMVECTLAGGHLLIEGPPGLAKTTAVRCLSEAVEGQWQRIQFTADLLPSDLIGTRVWDPSRADFTFDPGPIFANFVLADEINRAPAKVQSALLEAMAESQVTAGRVSMALPAPFLVLATQNPLEAEGTYLLPESQTDRFLMKCTVTYPSAEEEEAIVSRYLSPVAGVDPLVPLDRLREMAAVASSVFVPQALTRQAVALVQDTRREGTDIAFGSGPRGTLALVRAMQTAALMDGRPVARSSDLEKVALRCLRHRIVLSRKALLEGVSPDSLLEGILQRHREGEGHR